MKDRFSERKGLVEIRNELMKNDLTKEMRNRLWNAFTKTIWNHFRAFGLAHNFNQFFADLWDNHFKAPTDKLPHKRDHIYTILRGFFLGLFRGPSKSVYHHRRSIRFVRQAYTIFI